MKTFVYEFLGALILQQLSLKNYTQKQYLPSGKLKTIVERIIENCAISQSAEVNRVVICAVNLYKMN